MCVIMIAEKRKPTLEEIKKADQANPHGIGISWVDNGFIHWKKGLSYKQAFKVVDNIPALPFVLHARLSSVGKCDDKTLNHPFVADNKATNTLKGSTRKPVVFHNGHWSGYNIALMGKPNQPKGSMSDTRAIAWLGYLDSGKTFELVDEKLAILKINSNKSGAIIDVYGNFQDDDGLLCSNLSWKSGIGYTFGLHDRGSTYYQNQMSWEKPQPKIANKKKSGLKVSRSGKNETKKVSDPISSGDLESCWNKSVENDKTQDIIDAKLLDEHPSMRDPFFFV